MLGRTSSEVFVFHFSCLSSFVHVPHFVAVSSFDFQATLPCYRHSILASQACEGHYQLWALPRLLLIAFSCSSTVSAMVLSGHFLPTGIFYLTLLPNIFGTTCFYQGFSGSHRNTDLTHLFVWFTVIHNLLYILNLYWCMLILQKFYLWWKLW